MHICANNHWNSKILFGKNKNYILYYDYKQQSYKNQNGISTNGIPALVKEEGFGAIGNEYAILLHNKMTTKPVIGDAKNLELCGNGCTISIADGEFDKGLTSDFGIFESGGRVDGLKIHGFVFDGNYFEQYNSLNSYFI